MSLWFRAPGAGYDNASPGISRLAATAATARAAGVRKVTRSRSCITVGGDLNISVYPDIVNDRCIRTIGIGTPEWMAAMTAAYFAPAIDDVVGEDRPSAMRRCSRSQQR